MAKPTNTEFELTIKSKRFKKIRESLAFNQGDFAKVSKINPSIVSDIERGVRAPTRLQSFAVEALQFIDRHGLLYKFISRRKS